MAKITALSLLLYQTQSENELIKHQAAEHARRLDLMDGFTFWRYYFPSFQQTNWTFIAYILKIINSMREAGVSAIEAHRKVRYRRINFSVLLLPQEKDGKAKLIHKSSHNLTTRGFEDGNSAP